MLNLNEFPQAAMLGGHIVKVAMDPMGKFPNANQQDLLEACGLIPQIFSRAAGEPDTEDAEDLYKAAVQQYGYGDMASDSWGTVHSDGTYESQYDEDPDLYPLVVFRWPFGVEVLVYRHAIIAVRDEDNTIISRMD